MKAAVTGCKGQLGTDVVTALEKLNIEVAGADLPEVDITDSASVRAFLEKEKPDFVIHLAAYTAVDRAESEKDLCRMVNSAGTENIAVICGEKDIPLLYTSTDYVFGSDDDSFRETDSPVAPCNYYGQTKLEGEEAVRKYCRKHFIVRISWVFGLNGKNFVYTVLRLAETHDAIDVVSDQIGSPTFTQDLANLICEMVRSEKYGTYHATNEGVCSWAEFAEEIIRLSGRNTVIRPISTSEYKTDAVRPLNSRLSKKSLDEGGFSRLPHWKDALERFMIQAGIAE